MLRYFSAPTVEARTGHKQLSDALQALQNRHVLAVLDLREDLERDYHLREWTDVYAATVARELQTLGRTAWSRKELDGPSMVRFEADHLYCGNVS